MKRIVKMHEFPIISFTLTVFILLSIFSPNFLEINNIKTIFSQINITGIVAIGMTMVILFGGIDLSVGSVIAVVSISVGLLMNNGMNVWLAILIGLIIGLLCGVINGLIITKLNIPDIIATLGTMYLFRGVAITISGGSWVTNFPKEFTFFSYGSVLGLPISFVTLILLALLFIYILHFTPLGRKVYAIGGNKNAAVLSGISIKKTKFKVYLFSGLLSGIAAIFFAADVGSIQASTVGSSLAFDVLAAVLIGGASIFGGVGTVFGSMIGVLLIGIVKNGVVISQISVFWVEAITGFLIIIAILFNTVKELRSRQALGGRLN